MAASPRVLRLLTGIGIVAGLAVAYWRPQWPLLVYWLVLASALGVSISITPALTGLRQRAAWLMSVSALLIAFGLGTTQLAARRAISPTHLTYRGVHLAGVDSFTVGAGDFETDVRLQPAPIGIPWSMRVVRSGPRLLLQPLRGIEQLRAGPLRPGSRIGAFSVAQSAILASGADWAVIVDPAGTVVDTLRMVDGKLQSARRNVFLLRPTNDAIAARYGRRLRSGTSLSALDGTRASPSAYERFVRVQELSTRNVVNGVSYPFLRRVFGGRGPLLVSAVPPYRLRGRDGGDRWLVIADSAIVEVRSGDATWRFALHANWRRQPSADPGVTLLFAQNPSPLETPLPAGVSCSPGAACGAISLRRLPPPVAHIALDYAGFDPDRYGLLGTLRVLRTGYQVILPRERFDVERGRSRPVAIPVTELSSLSAPVSSAAPARSTRWILLGATGEGDYSVMILAVGIGLALLFAAIYRVIATVSIRVPTPATIGHERAIMVGITAILALILTRVIVGARVRFFDPFLERGIETAVGLCVAIALVAVGLLTWSAWLPPFFAGARATLTGQRPPGRILAGIVHAIERLWVLVRHEPTRTPALLVAASLVVLAISSPGAVGYGLATGVVVLMTWVTVAWVTAFSGPYFETFERGAQSVVEHLSPPAPIGGVARTPARGSPNADRPSLSAAVLRLLRRVPELPLMLACVAAEFAHMFPKPLGAVAAIAVFVLAPVIIARRRRQMTPTLQPDYFAAAIGVAAFMACIAALRVTSENGSMGAFVLVVFVALAAVRIGRGVGSRLETSAQSTTPSTAVAPRLLLIESLLLAAPLVLLLPLASLDMGLGLVMVVPLGFATLLAAGWRTARWRLLVPSLAMFGVIMLARQVVFPSLRPIRDADSHATQAKAFARMSEPLGTRLPMLGTPMDRAAARSVTTRDRPLAEALLVAAQPGPARDLLIPSIEQIWGAQAYANAGLWGEGLGQAVIGGRGVAETVSYAENTFSVFVLAEHGAVGGALVLCLYLLLTGAVAACVLGSAADTPSYRASRALFLVAALIVAVPALYVALSNLGLLPITGQNMPFLGLNAWSDVAICAGVVGILLTGAMRGLEEAGR